jgi:quinol---cytochrome c reductase iron-sulfur subunit, bacillus type
MISLPALEATVSTQTIDTTPADAGRRRFLSTIASGILTVIGGIVAFIGGGAVLSSSTRRQEDWLPASTLVDLPEHEPTPVMLTVRRLDGFREVLDRRTIFLVKTGESDVAAFSATCTHLGCLVAWDAEGQVFKCPCHGGVYDKTGAVKDGPPPAPLTRIATRVDGERVLVQA